MNELTDIFTSYLQNGDFSLFVLLISFAGGVISSLSPCTLGILPIVTGYVIGYDNERKSFYTFIQMLSFVLGLSVILTAIGIICALSGKVFIAIGGNYWVLFMASLIMILGLNLVGVVEIPIPVIIKKMPKTKGKSLFIYPFILNSLSLFTFIIFPSDFIIPSFDQLVMFGNNIFRTNVFGIVNVHSKVFQ